MLENRITATPDLGSRKSFGGGSNNSLRRRSLLHRVQAAPEEEKNDDDAERSSLLASEKAMTTSTPLVASPRQRLASRDLSSSPQKEHYQGCLKLYTENKINKDNAWNLQLIDFMTSMLRRHDARIENLQTASTLVDASARIYSFRVDAVHFDVLKIAGGLSKATQSKRGKKDDENGQDDGAVDNDAPNTQAKKKKKRYKGAIANNIETLNGDFEANLHIDPFFERLAATQGDITSSNRAFNASLPIHDKTLALILRTDDQFLESIKENISEELELRDRITISNKLLPAFNEEDFICEPFHKFSITNWDPDTEDSDNRVNNWVEDNRLNLSQQAMAFDVNAEVEPIPLEDDHNDLLDDEPLAGIESDEEADVAVAACVARIPAAPLARLTDMRPTGAQDTRLEYSYCGAIVSAWAGPAHWRLKNNRASKLTDPSHTATSGAGRTTVDAKKPARAKRQIDFMNAGLTFDWHKPPPEFDSTPETKIMISKKTLATRHTWNENNYKRPVDRGLDETFFRKLFLRENVMLLRKRDIELTQQPEPEPVVVDEVKEYDYNNENDASYCPNSAPDMDEWGNEDAAAAAGDVHEQTKAMMDGEELGDMIEPPVKVAKIFIPYAMRAKHVDMKQLKHAAWKIITHDSSKQKEPEQQENLNAEEKTFSKVYTKLPTKLSSNMKESLSPSLALLSVLFLANEKNLFLDKQDDLKDFTIKVPTN